MSACEIELSANGTRLRLELLGRPEPGSDPSWDRDAIYARLSVQAPPFVGELPLLTGSHELAALRNILRALDRGVGAGASHTFTTFEGELRLEFRLGVMGGLAVAFEVSGSASNSAKLTGTLDADQSYLPGWIDMLDAALAQFPVT